MNIDRRSLVFGSVSVVTSALATRVAVATEVQAPFNVDPLPYATNALEPYLDARTMELHHDRHHQGYVNALNALAKDHTAIAAMSLAEIGTIGRYCWVAYADCRQEKIMQSEIATIPDAEAVADLVNAAYRGAGGQHGWTHEGELIAGTRAKASDVAAMIGSSATTVLIRRQGESSALLGCVAVEMDGDNHCTISMLAVSPALQREAVGRAMLEDAEWLAANKGVTIVKITVVQQRDALLAWYERRGYRRTGKHEAFPYGDDSVGTPLRDDLQFVVLEKAI